MSSLSTTVISAERQERLPQFLTDLWDYRELFWTFVERDIKVRYKQTALGVIWVILQPLFVAGAFSVIFGKIARMPTDGLPYALFYLSALVAWNTFATSVSQCAVSMETNAGLISKVYFPRVIAPGAIVFSSILDFAIGWVLLNIVAIWFGHWHWQLVALTPLLLVIQATTAFGIGAALAALNAQYRDVKHAISFLIQVFMLATPVIYPASRLPLAIQPWLFLNPMAAVVTTYRDCVQGTALNGLQIALSFLASFAYLGAGLWLFRKLETRLADIL